MLGVQYHRSISSDSTILISSKNDHGHGQMNSVGTAHKVSLASLSNPYYAIVK